MFRGSVYTFAATTTMLDMVKMSGRNEGVGGTKHNEAAAAAKGPGSLIYADAADVIFQSPTKLGKS